VYADRLATALQFESVQRARLVLAAFQSAMRAHQRGGGVCFRIEAGSPVILTVRNSSDTAPGFEFQLGGQCNPRLVPAGDLRQVDAPGVVERLVGSLAPAADSERELFALRGMIASLESELAETNRGVLALYAELDDRADKLKRADDLKSRFLSYASHELRTPLNGIIGIIRLLNTGRHRSHPDAEESKQLAFILKAAEEMRELINDLLDLAKVEAGKISVQPSEFGLDFVFGALRGIFRPLLQTDDVVLVFDDTSAVPAIYSDEAKVSQILRNLISNALKFTEHGEVHVWAEADNDVLRISVKDTGIGIAPEHLSRIFEEYAQIEHPLQRRVRGTGLGLPLCRKLTQLLGGHLEVESEIGKGSVFTLTLPLRYDSALPDDGHVIKIARRTRRRPTVLLIDHAEIDRYLLTQLVRAGGDYDLLQAEDAQLGLDIAQRQRPDIVFLQMSGSRTDAFTSVCERFAALGIPVVAVTDHNLGADADERQRLDGKTVAIISKPDLADARKVDIQVAPVAAVNVVRDRAVDGKRD